MNEFHYRIPGMARRPHPGHHRGSVLGSGLEFSRYAPLLSAPDLRRLDVRATLADPFGTWQVRVLQQRASIPVFLVADLSASMSFHDGSSKVARVASFADSLAYSVYRTGDAFGLIACDDDIIAGLLLYATRARSAGVEACARLAAFEATGGSARGLLEVADVLGRERSLMFLASDFHLPLELLDQVLERLAPHDVVPMMLWDDLRSDAAFHSMPRFGLLDLEDAENHKRRMLMLRPGLRERWGLRFAERRRALLQCFARHARRPFFVGRQFDAQAMTAYFFAGDIHGVA